MAYNKKYEVEVSVALRKRSGGLYSESMKILDEIDYDMLISGVGYLELIYTDDGGLEVHRISPEEIRKELDKLEKEQ